MRMRPWSQREILWATAAGGRALSSYPCLSRSDACLIIVLLASMLASTTDKGLFKKFMDKIVVDETTRS
uniref:Uncharacterized protein n=1 Tax=Leersia perrieri TaxID=77586 RepID=A0A0D9V6E3_9ORYZ